MFKPIYDRYAEIFFDNVIQNMGMGKAFGEFRDTGIFERYMLNTVQFSAAKSYSEGKLLQDAVFDGQRVRSYPEFERAAQDITDINQKTWLRVEYETSRRNAVSGSKFAQMQSDSDLYPYWIYRGRMDSKERPEHVALEGKIFRMGDPNGDKIYPPNGNNCRCDGDPVDEYYLKDNNVRYVTNDEAKQLLQSDVDESFRYNAAVQGPMPNEHSYFDVFPNANHGSAGLFDLGAPGDADRRLEGLDAAHNMRYLMETVSEWRKTYHVDQQHNIVFQNKATLANVRLSDGVISKILRHPHGFHNLPETIEHPSEIWATWEDVKDQRVVMRNYLLFGRLCYMVKTRDGQVTDALALSRGSINKYRKGLILA